jgi:Peptidase family M28
MLITRREWLSSAAGSAFAAVAFRSRVAAVQDATAGELEDRISRIINEYARQGFHRTGTTVDRVSGDWLCEEVRQTGLAPTRESFSLSRVDLVANVLIAPDRRIDGVPLFDGGFTDTGGIRGRLGALQSDGEIGLAETAPNAAASGPLGDARRTNRHKAIVCVTRGQRPGLCPSNADFFVRPFGPPVLQVSSDQDSWLTEQARRGVEVQLISHVARARATAVNVTATLEGADPRLAPLVISTPRSGWYSCASERGGGIACWLEAMRALRMVRPARTVIFVAFSGHELGSLGIHAFVDRRPAIISKAAAWIHFGANIGAATDPGNRLAASDDDFDRMASHAMASAGLSVDQRIPRGGIPGGEAEVVHRAGGRYVAVTGRNALFHNLEDRGPHAVNPSVIARFSTAFIAAARSMGPL